MTDAQVVYRESEIRKYFPEALVQDYENLIGVMINHPKDRHVLAAAVRCHAEAIVTFNAKDFPKTALDPYSITAMGPSGFLHHLYDLDRDIVTNTLLRQAAAIHKPIEYVLDRLSVNAPGFVRFFRTTGS